MHGQVTEGHYQTDGFLKGPQMYPGIKTRRVPVGYEWDATAQDWLLPLQMSEPPRRIKIIIFLGNDWFLSYRYTLGIPIVTFTPIERL